MSIKQDIAAVVFCFLSEKIRKTPTALMFGDIGTFVPTCIYECLGHFRTMHTRHACTVASALRTRNQFYLWSVLWRATCSETREQRKRGGVTETEMEPTAQLPELLGKSEVDI